MSTRPEGASRARAGAKERCAAPRRPGPARASTALLSLLLSLGGCGGGMIGTGTGPDEPPVRQASALSGRVGTDLPATLLDPGILASMRREAFGDGTGDDAGDGVPVSEQWRTLVGQIADVERLRLESEAFLILVDAVLPTVRSRCDETGRSVCRLPAGSVEGRYTDALVAAVEAVYVRALGSADQAIAGGLDELRAELRSRLGTRYRLGEIELAPGDGQPYDIDLSTSLDDVLRGHRLRVRSNAEGTRKELTIGREVGGIVDRRYIGFSTGLPGERFTYTRDRFTGSGIEDRFDVSIVADGSSERRVLLDARRRERVGGIVDDTLFRAQADERGGFATSREYEAVGEGIRDVRVTEESFAADGALRAGRACSAEPGAGACADPAGFASYGTPGEVPADSPLHFDAAGFDVLIGMNDVIRFRVVGLPADVVDFQVLGDDDALPLAERDVLCTGVQPVPGDARLYCAAPADRLPASVVVAVDADGGAVSRLPLASVVPR